jgi:ribonuclease D
MARDLLSQAQVAVDTESNSLFAYREQVCLVQFSAGEKDYLLDSLALQDLRCLEPLFASPAIEKVFHAAEYDLICLRRDFGFTFTNLFDTMVAARVLGRDGVGLGAMLEAEFGLYLDKRYQRANWGERPLKPALLAYARLDSHYLVALRQRLEPALREAGRWEMAQEDFIRLCTAPIPSENHTPNCWRAAGSKDLTPRQATVLEALCLYREERARLADLPPFKVLGNDSLLSIALAAPRDLNALDALSVLSSRQREKHAAGLLQAVQRGLVDKVVRRPSSSRPDERYLLRIDRLRTWRKEVGRQWGVESDVILPREKMEALAQAGPKTMQELGAQMADLPWRFAQFGPQIYKKLNGSEA